MDNKRVRHTSDFKAKVAIEAIKGQKTLNEMASLYGVHSNQIVRWKKQATDEMSALFSGSTTRKDRDEAVPEIFNTDQGSQYTAKAFIDLLKVHPIRISMDGRGRALDNVFVERLWRSVKQEEVYLHDYRDVTEAKDGLSAYFRWYNQERLHQSLSYNTPESVYTGRVTLVREVS